MRKMPKYQGVIGLILGISLTWIGPAWAEDQDLQEQGTVELTLIHTNDLHSHFRPEKGPLGLGGVARLKTAIDRIRKEVPNTLLLDGGDWSEGGIYYNEGTGIEDLKMMDALGYDAAVVGNHDWLNGPDTLLDILAQVQPKTTYLAANVSAENFSRADEFAKRIPPYVIRNVGGVKVALIGLVTYEFIYDKFLKPIKISEPVLSTATLAARLKGEEGVKVVIAISHNSVTANQTLLTLAPAVDLVIGAHDHKMLTKPVEVSRLGTHPGWVFETGSFGRYLGRVNLVIDKDGLRLAPKQTFLIQMDSKIPEDPSILAQLEALEARIEDRYGRIFHDHIGSSQIALNKKGLENAMGNLVTDAFVEASHADFAIDSSAFIPGEFQIGEISTVDVFNALPAIYNPATQKSWTLKTLPIKGRTLKWLLYAFYASKKISSYGFLSVSGLSFIYDPFFPIQNFDLQPRMSINSVSAESIPVVKDIRIQGKPLDENKIYQMGVSGGLIESIDFVNTHLFKLLDLDEARDTGLESWRVLKDHISAHSPLNEKSVTVGDRIRTLQANLGVLSEDIRWVPKVRGMNSMSAEITVKVTNFGASPSEAGTEQKGPRVHLWVNRNGLNYAVDPNYKEVGALQAIPSLKPGESHVFQWNIDLPAQGEYYPVTAKIEGTESAVAQNYTEAARWFRAETNATSEPLESIMSSLGFTDTR